MMVSNRTSHMDTYYTSTEQLARFYEKVSRQMGSAKGNVHENKNQSHKPFDDILPGYQPNSMRR